MELIGERIPMSMQIYENMIKEMQEHSLRNEEVYQLQINTLKEKLKEKDEIIISMSRNLNSLSEQTHSEVGESRHSIFEEPESLTAFTINRRNTGLHQQSSHSNNSNLDKTQKHSQVVNQPDNQAIDLPNQQAQSRVSAALSIEQETKYLKQELNELFKTKEAESQQLNRIIDELKLQLIDYQTQKINLIDVNHQLSLDNAKIVAQLQELNGACNNLKEICNQQTQELEGKGLTFKTQAAEIDSLKEQIKVNSEAAQAYIRAKQTELLIKVEQVQELLQANANLLSQIQSLKKQKQTKKEHSEKQHRLIVQYQKKNEENIREIRKLQTQLLIVTGELDAQRTNYSKLEAQTRSYAQAYEKELSQREATIEELNTNFKNKYLMAANRITQYLLQVLSGFREELSNLKEDLWSWSHSITDMLAQTTGTFQFTSVSCAGSVQGSNISVFNREELLEFQVEQLKKELINIKKENFELKFENKKLLNRKANVEKKQEELRVQIDRLSEQLKSRPHEKFQTQQLQGCELFKISDINNKTAVQTRIRKDSKSRRQSANDYRIIQQITEMRRRIRDVREECQIKSNR